MEITEISHGELRTKMTNNILKEFCGESCQNNVINIEQYVGKYRAMLKDKK